jgi:short-subunit dehydrogenase
VVIITGASSGLGAAAARRLGQEKMRLVLAARREAELVQVAAEVEQAGGQALVLPTDVRDRGALHEMVRTATAAWGRVDVLFNNAGLGVDAGVMEIDPDSLRAQVAVNIVGVVECAQAVLPLMLQQKQGHIINVSSIAGLISLPGWSAYTATKYAICGFSEALRRELRRTGVTVTEFCPYWVETGLSPILQPPLPGEQRIRPLIPLLRTEQVAERLVQLILHPRR